MKLTNQFLNILSYQSKQLCFLSRVQFARSIKVSIKNQYHQQQEDEKAANFTSNLQDPDTDLNNKIDDDAIIPMNQFKGFKDVENVPENKGEKMDKEQIKTIQETVLFKGDDPYYDKLVERPQKGMLWGLGGQLMKTEINYFDIKNAITVDTIKGFLDLNQIKDIEVVDLSQFKEQYQYKYGIVGSMYSSVHGWKVCKDLVKSILVFWEEEQKVRQQQFENEISKLERNISQYALQKRELENKEALGKGFRPQVYGVKDDEWLMVEYKDIMVHLVTEDSRAELKLVKKWTYIQTPEDEAEMDKVSRVKRNKYFEPL